MSLPNDQIELLRQRLSDSHPGFNYSNSEGPFDLGKGKVYSVLFHDNSRNYYSVYLIQEGKADFSKKSNFNKSKIYESFRELTADYNALIERGNQKISKLDDEIEEVKEISEKRKYWEIVFGITLMTVFLLMVFVFLMEIIFQRVAISEIAIPFTVALIIAGVGGAAALNPRAARWIVEALKVQMLGKSK